MEHKGDYLKLNNRYIIFCTITFPTQIYAFTRVSDSFSCYHHCLCRLSATVTVNVTNNMLLIRTQVLTCDEVVDDIVGWTVTVTGGHPSHSLPSLHILIHVPLDRVGASERLETHRQRLETQTETGDTDRDWRHSEIGDTDRDTQTHTGDRDLRHTDRDWRHRQRHTDRDWRHSEIGDTDRDTQTETGDTARDPVRLETQTETGDIQTETGDTDRDWRHRQKTHRQRVETQTQTGDTQWTPHSCQVVM